MSLAPARIAVSGAAGAIGYSLLFRIAAGDLLGPNQPVELRLLEVDDALGKLEGIVMELQDCAFPLLAGIETGSDARTMFSGVNQALLVGARPRGPGMERGDLLEVNGRIFGPQGAALGDVAADDVRVTVTGNPANTNCLIAMQAAEDIPSNRFSALTRLDQNRAVAQLAAKTGSPVGAVQDVIVWGNHSATQYPDITHATIDGRAARLVIDDDAWLTETFIPTVAKRGAAIIDARGASSAASAASATIDHVRDWALGSEGRILSMAVCSDGSYGVPEGLVSSFPVTIEGGEWRIVPDLPLDDFSRARIDASVAELTSERDAVRALGLIR